MVYLSIRFGYSSLPYARLLISCSCCKAVPGSTSAIMQVIRAFSAKNFEPCYHLVLSNEPLLLLGGRAGFALIAISAFR